MRIQEKCIPCTIQQAIKVADMVGLKEKDELLRKVFAYMSKVDFKNSTTPELIGEIFSLLKKETGNEDPYKETRIYYNNLFLRRLSDLEQEIDRADDPFAESVKYAIIGNIIDFNPIHDMELPDVEGYFARLKMERLEIDDSGILRQEIKKARSILYLGDNCGEICLDKILVKKMKEINPHCHIFFAVRGTAVVNDSVEEDAYAVGMDSYATIISNGDFSLGTVLHRVSEEFQEVYRQADIVIAKGQANYECLSEEKKNVYLLLMTKCKVIADDIGVDVLKMACMRSSEIFLFPGEILVDTVFDKGVRFDIVKRNKALWCGTLGYAPNLTDEPDIEGLLARYQALASVEKRGLVSPEWSGCISMGYWPGGGAPRGIMFMQQAASAEQDERYDVYKTPASLYIRIHYDSAEIPQKLFGKGQCEVFELYGAIHELAGKKGYEAVSPVGIEFEYYGSTSCYAYCAVKEKE